MRRVLTLALACAFVITLGCGSGDDDAAPAGTPATRPSGASPSTGGVRPGSPAAQSPAALSDGNAPGIPPLTGEIKTENGVRYIDELIGSGAPLQQGQTVAVHYTGWLTNGRQFDSSIPRNQPYPVQLGRGGVIDGWQIGLASMRVGGKRRLIIPPELAYGSQDRRDQDGNIVIPANSTLIFDVEAVSAQ
jgi:hypothetical protein